MDSSRVFIDMDSKRELFIPNTETHIPHDIEDSQHPQTISELDSSFLSNFTSNMNMEIKDEPKGNPVIEGELYRAGSPEPLYRPNIHHEIFQVDQWNKNIIPNVEYPYPTNQNDNFAVPSIAEQMEKLFPTSLPGFNCFRDPNYYLPKPITQMTINEINDNGPLKKPRGRPKKNPLDFRIKEKQSTRRAYTKKNKPIATEPGTSPLIAPKRPVGRPRNQPEGHQQQTEAGSSASAVASMVVPPEQQFKAISHEFEPISGGEDSIQILKMPTEKSSSFPPERKFRSMKSLTESFDFNFKYKHKDFNTLRAHVGFPPKLPLLMNQLSWDPKATHTDIAKFACLKCNMCFRYQYDFVCHECEGKKLASFCTNCWTMFPFVARKKRRKNGIKLPTSSDDEESEKVPPHSCDPSKSLKCTECNAQFVNSFDMLQHYNLHYV